MRPGMVAQRGPVIQPDLQDGLEVRFAETAGAAAIHEADQRNAAQRREQLHGHGANGRQVAPLRQIAAARQIVDGDGHLAWLAESGQREAENREPEHLPIVTLRKIAA
jgi:hypothetical protein